MVQLIIDSSAVLLLLIACAIAYLLHCVEAFGRATCPELKHYLSALRLKDEEAVSEALRILSTHNFWPSSHMDILVSLVARLRQRTCITRPPRSVSPEASAQWSVRLPFGLCPDRTGHLLCRPSDLPVLGESDGGHLPQCGRRRA